MGDINQGGSDDFKTNGLEDHYRQIVGGDDLKTNGLEFPGLNDRWKIVAMEEWLSKAMK